MSWLHSFAETALEFLRHHWTEGLEILLIAAMIYAVLLMLRSARGAGMMRGLAILAAVAVVFSGVRYLGLLRISWLLEKLLAISAVALVVIFQPELRRMLVRLGQTRFLGFFGRARSMALDEIISALAAMSKRRIGVLIAIQREDSLAQIVEGGTRLEAEVSSELLSTIFYPNTLLHDGGVVIRSNRVAAAGCLFPLSENPKLPRELGTRHRAAVGLTEETDAVVVVVSEETGRISVAVRGDLMLDLSVEDLKSVLHNLCYEAMESAVPGQE
jgi:diadenylate cyclase